MILLILVFLLSSTTADHFSNQQPKGGNAQPQVNTEKLKQQAQELSSKMKMKVAEGTLVGDAREGQNQDCNFV